MISTFGIFGLCTFYKNLCPRYLQGVLHKGRTLLQPIPLFRQDPAPCFASKKAKEKHDYAFEFSFIRVITCYALS
jgi:hypothetical protein